LSHPKLEALHVFTRQVVCERGKVSERMTEAFFDAGWKPQQVLEIILGVSIKTMSNYTNAIVQVPLDEVVKNEL
jgi:alkylhydroperoxidase family enzyme